MTGSVRRAAVAGRSRRLRRPAAARSSLMNVGRRVEYALRALCYMAAQPSRRPVTRAEIQRRQVMPPHFLSKVLRHLVAAGLLRSVPGAHGGFRLARPAERISVLAVYECIEGDLSLVDCIERREEYCGFAAICTQQKVWRGARRVLADYLGGISIREIADRQGLVARLEGSQHRPVSRP